MNYNIIRSIIGKIIILTGLLMLIPLITSLIYNEGIKNYISFLIPIALQIIVGLLLNIKKTRNMNITAREGFVIVALSWIIMSLFGAIPFLISGEIKSFFTAFFEITSGFTTTGASALTSEELLSMSHSMLLWRSFSHWIGGMGVLVFILAIIPESKNGTSVHILRAESPGPQVGRLVSKMQVTSRILYVIYLCLSLLEFIILLIIPDKDMGVFESLIYTFGTAGTGGFATTTNSIAAYSVGAQYCIATFMMLFGINFTMFYLILIGNFKEVFKNSELRFYLFVVISSTILIMLNIRSKYQTLEETFRYSFFTVSSIISTTGFSNVDYVGDAWPTLSIMIILILTAFGACAGSTSGGIKNTRIVIMLKHSLQKLKSMISPRSVSKVTLDGKVVDDTIIDSVLAFLITYMIIFVSCALLISVYNPKIENLDILSTLTASLTCISNVGPGLGIVGPAGGYADFSWFSKLIMSFEMMAGRLELFPILILFNPKTWKKRV